MTWHAKNEPTRPASEFKESIIIWEDARSPNLVGATSPEQAKSFLQGLVNEVPISAQEYRPLRNSQSLSRQGSEPIARTEFSWIERA